MGRNIITLAALLTAPAVLFALLGQALGGAAGSFLALTVTAALAVGLCLFSDRIVLRLAGAREMAREESPALCTSIMRLATRAHLPVPKLYVIPGDVPNAFAIGRDPRHGVVAVSFGIDRLLTRDEIDGVLAHELAHIKHRDTFLAAVVTTIFGVVVALVAGGPGKKAAGAAGALRGPSRVFLAPLATILVPLACGRSREFRADAYAAHLLGDPLPLASALEKLAWYGEAQSFATHPAVAPLCVVNPLSGRALAGLFGAHPPTAERVTRLRALARADLAQEVVIAS